MRRLDRQRGAAAVWIGLALGAIACGGSGDGTAADTEADEGSDGATTSPAAEEGDGTSKGDDGDGDGATESSAATESSSGSSGSSDDAPSTDGTTGGPGPADDAPRYDDVQQKSAHNSYQRHEAIVDQLVYHRVRSIELDIHVGKTLEPDVPGDWYVYHTDVADDGTSCRRLSDCLGELVVFGEAAPQHEVVTLLVDLKDDWGDGHRPADLDTALHAALGDALYEPGELLASCPGAPDLASAVRDPACGWPTLEALRGRVIVALTGGGVNGPTRKSSKLSKYLAEGSRAFVMPDATGSPSLDAPHPGVVLYNASADELDAAEGVVQAGFVARAWGLNDAAAWTDAAARGVHHLATDKVNVLEDPWASTASPGGWPFSCPGGCDGEPSVPSEPVAIVGIEVDSGDIWSTGDDFWFEHVDASAAPQGEWTALVSTVNSHVEPFAKGCLMARAGLSADAPYLAVCRPADEEPLRAQLRATPGADSEAVENDIAAPGTVSPASVAWLRLRIDDSGTCATAFGARHFGEWIQIASHCFDEPLTHQGLAASSHDAGPVRLLFVAPARDGTPVTLSELSGADVGSASAIAFEGPVP